jgi:hypothetical protein
MYELERLLSSIPCFPRKWETALLAGEARLAQLIGVVNVG